MYVVKPYDRLHAQNYALRWGLSRNPLFYDFSAEGGDCTNFASQCVLAGSCEMNYTETYGWYYLSPNERSAAWTGVEYFYRFMTSNDGVGPFGREVGSGGAELGDIIQLGGRNGVYYHTLVITGFERNTFLITAHTDDSLSRRLTSYSYDRIRFIHIEGVRFAMADTNACFDALYNGLSITGAPVPVSPINVPAEQPSLPQQPEDISTRPIVENNPENFLEEP